jgi:hypothetical protein
MEALFTLLINNEKDNSKLTDSINEIYRAIRNDINPKAKSFKNQVFRTRPSSESQPSTSESESQPQG